MMFDRRMSALPLSSHSLDYDRDHPLSTSLSSCHRFQIRFWSDLKHQNSLKADRSRPSKPRPGRKECRRLRVEALSLRSHRLCTKLSSQTEKGVTLFDSGLGSDLARVRGCQWPWAAAGPAGPVSRGVRTVPGARVHRYSLAVPARGPERRQSLPRCLRGGATPISFSEPNCSTPVSESGHESP